MKPVVKFVAFAIFAASTIAVAQETSNQSGSALPASSPDAYVYVSTTNSQIYGYSASSTGALTAIPGSPFSSKSQAMALTDKYLFGTDYTWIYSYGIGSTGALTYISKFDATEKNPYDSGGPGNLFLDHTGSSLYDGDIYAYGTGDNAYQYFDINHTTGHFYYLGITTDLGEDSGGPLSFIGDNEYAYTSDCYHDAPPVILGFRRNSDGSLTDLNINPPIPAPPSNATNYCTNLAAADPTTHVAIAMQPVNEYSVAGTTQLAVYTADSSGNLTTTSTMSNMPKVSVTSVTDMAMAPAGNLLAVAGSSGLQVFHFNGSNPITSYTGLLTNAQVDQMFWDNANHLYAISHAAGKLYVFTVTPTTHSQASGSPHAIANLANVIVLPKT